MFGRIMMMCIVMLVTLELLAQEDTSVLVGDILITSTTIGKGFQDSISSNQPIIDALSRESNLYLKTNGLGTSITSSYQGGNANHTTVFINGIPFANPLIGQTDFSLLQVLEVNSAELVNDLSEESNEAVAGSLTLTTYDEFNPNKKVSYEVTTKSFNHFEHRLALKSVTDKLSLALNVNKLDTKNNYPFYIEELDENRRQTHARQDITQATLNVGYKHNNTQTIQGFFWYHDQYREIPPTLTQTNSEQTQEDQFSKLGITYTSSLGKYFITSNYGFTDQSLLFVDGQVSYPASFQQHYFSASASRKLNNQWTQTYNYSIDRNIGQNHSYQTDQVLQVQKLSIAANRRSANSMTQLNGQLLHSTLDKPWGITYQIHHTAQLAKGSLKGSIRKLWRAPSLNDLFWVGGGTEDLLPERGYSLMLGYLSPKEQVLPIQVSLFSRWVDDYILWRPSDGSPIWKASNVNTVWSRGINFQLKYKVELQSAKLSFNTKHQLAYASASETIENIGVVKDQQLIYTPIYSNVFILGYRRSDWSVELFNRFTSGYAGVNDDVDGNLLFDMSIDKKINLGKQITIQGVLEINNLLDRPYYIIERRPMPGRHGMIKLIFSHDK